MDFEKFEPLVNEGIAMVPHKFIQRLKNVAIIVEEEPSPEQIRKMRLNKNDLLFGLYEGVPQIRRGAYYSALPDKITIFKNQIEQYTDSDEEIKKIVADTVWHEIAHHFGSTEPEIRKAEKRRRSTRN